MIEAGIKRVFIATLDQNPLVKGKGVAELEKHGITTEVGLGESDALELNQAFFHYITHRKPFVIAKWAMSLDGKTITQATDSKIISNKRSHDHAHCFRASVDAILIGAETARQDNPLLTARTSKATRQPLRIILSRNGEIDANLKIFTQQSLAKTLLVTSNAISQKKACRVYP